MDVQDYLAGFSSRHDGLLTPAEQETLQKTLVCSAGVGGNGGYTCLALAHMGVRRFRLADPDVFEPANANHQAGCNIQTVGRPKAEVIASRIREMLPDAQVDTFTDGVTPDNVEMFLEDADIVLDCIDLYAPEAKKMLYDRSRARGLPVFSSPILGFGTGLGVFDPQRSPSFSEHFGEIPDRADEAAYRTFLKRMGMGFFGFRPRFNWASFAERVYAGRVPSVGAACMLTGALVCTAVVDYVLGYRNFPVVPETLHIDLMDRRMVKVGRGRRWFLRRVVGPMLAALEKRPAENKPSGTPQEAGDKPVAPAGG